MVLKKATTLQNLFIQKKGLIKGTYTWTMDNYHELDLKRYVCSPTFEVGGHKWYSYLPSVTYKCFLLIMCMQHQSIYHKCTMPCYITNFVVAVSTSPVLYANIHQGHPDVCATQVPLSLEIFQLNILAQFLRKEPSNSCSSIFRDTQKHTPMHHLTCY